MQVGEKAYKVMLVGQSAVSASTRYARDPGMVTRSLLVVLCIGSQTSLAAVAQSDLIDPIERLGAEHPLCFYHLPNS